MSVNCRDLANLLWFILSDGSIAQQVPWKYTGWFPVNSMLSQSAPCPLNLWLNGRDGPLESISLMANVWSMDYRLLDFAIYYFLQIWIAPACQHHLWHPLAVRDYEHPGISGHRFVKTPFVFFADDDKACEINIGALAASVVIVSSPL